MEPWKDLSGIVVMVTGASSGIGRELCLDLAKAGCSIIAAARHVDRLKSLCSEINLQGPRRAFAVELDITANGATIEAAVQIAWDAFRHIDALVTMPAFEVVRMRDAKQGGGSVINISSAAALNRALLPGSLAYVSSKMALDMVTKIMALELGVDKIRVNSIAPGVFKSEITENLVQQKRFHNAVFKAVPLRTFGTTDPALTSAVRYLIHDSSEYVSGNVFIVDGGSTLPGVPIFSSL
ncbi:tropinone reductase-like protein [Nicotiana attenuata]|uniref:Tropinone reductase-like protein n=1 Tax=Nicotiana attenuata TaxID=49451 RepID=A0A1J6KP27_NICAT|nr:tropinone reductase-like protein [Nicotiana attenuata]